MPPLLDLSAAGQPAPIAISGGERSLARASRPTSMRQSSGGAPPIQIDRVPAADDTDTATAQTVQMMCDYIRKAASDPLVQACAKYAWQKFGMGSPDPAMKAWGCFWWMKHCIKFRNDEATMFRIGERNQQDFLLSPSVLFRMDKPAEDCDGFTMGEAVLLVCLGVPVVIATVAADPDDRNRWSHVFPVSIINGRALPLDASHGIGPGWMVPPQHIFRWQAWGLDGKPVEVRPMHHRGLHGYVRTGPSVMTARVRPAYRRRGVGDLCSEFGIGCDVLPPVTSSSSPDSYLQWGTPSSSSSSTGGGIWSFLSGLVSNAANVARVAVTPTTTVQYPGGPIVTGPAGSVPVSGGLFGSSSSLVPILGVGLLGILAISALRGKK